MKVSVIIVNFNGSKFLKVLFESLLNQTFKDFEVIFVDNGSTDNSLEMLTKTLPQEVARKLHLKIVRLQRNLGYCGGNNSGVRSADGDYIVFLNNDTYVAPTWLEELVDVVQICKSIGACQSRLVQAQTQKVQTDGWFIDKYGWSQRLFVRGRDLKLSRAPFYTSGASMIVRKSDFISIGFFDPELFYGDFDLCWRLRLIGYDMAVSLSSLCYHYGGIATKMILARTSWVEMIYHHDCEILRVFLKNFSVKYIIQRVPPSMILMIFEASFLSFKYRKPLCISSMLRSVAWNLKSLRDTLVCRYKVQSYRKVSDLKASDAMLKYSVLLKRRWQDWMD